MQNTNRRIDAKGPSGKSLGVPLEPARHEAKALRFDNIQFQFADITKDQPEQEFDVVYAPFLLTHLPQPKQALQRMYRVLRRLPHVVEARSNRPS
jgi:ubiquinone/menaquinone biosynthesis C-methylase UbiE